MRQKFNLVNNEKGWFITEENETEEERNTKSYSRIEEVFQRLNEQASEIETYTTHWNLYVIGMDFVVKVALVVLH